MNVRVITIPLITEPWQRDLLRRRMELCRSLYNAEQNRLERRYHSMQRDKRYQRSKSSIDAVYAMKPAQRAQAKETEGYRRALALQREVYGAYGFTAYTVHDRAILAARDHASILPSRVAHYTIGIPLWQAMHGILVGAQTGFRYKRRGDIHSLSSDGRSGIRLLGPAGTNAREGIDLTEWSEKARRGEAPKDSGCRVIYGKGKGKRAICLPLKISPKDTYLIDTLRNPIRNIRILRRTQDRRDCYCVQLMVDSAWQ